MEQKKENAKNVGFPVHSQVRKIKQEDEKIEDYPILIQAEIRPALREITRQLSRSPLGRQNRHPISVGES
ncbi:hypothetical protein H6P81_015802 [Aristolochia fimbriata]|uniref:Uncharacterized protein n=1 Tax=Aristolochia fimbriata TaxID=158543 RepID=A0AAV7EAA7_ARIFI|nr:hypothetical protein H6P81_015802 [Aristolochia fimbriata]